MNIYLVNILTAICCIIFGYFLGSIPNGVVIGRLFFHKDPRDFGSGNSGGSNSGRVFGAKIGLLVIVLDMLKAIVVIYTIWAVVEFTPLRQYYFVGGWDLTSLYYWLGALFVAIGHCWPIYIGFKGGKAVACFMGAAAGTSWFSFLLGIFYLGPLKIKKMVSVASLVGGFFQVVGAWTLYLVQVFNGFDIRFFMYTYALGDRSVIYGLWYAIAMTIIYLIMVFRHASNIKRIKAGNENKIHWLK